VSTSSEPRSEKKLFQEILSPQDKARIISHATADNVTIRAKINRLREFKTKPISWSPPMRLEVGPPAEIKLSLQPLTIQFDSEDERYFATVDVAFDDWKLFFIFNRSLFRLQRREYQRLKIPPKYQNRVLLMNVNEQVWNEECKIADISLGGCSLILSYKSIDVTVSDLVMMDIQLGDHPSFIQIGQICYKQLLKVEGQNKVRVGVKFRPHPKYALYLNSVVQNLAVDLFTNWSQRK
jgi:hypothetical protein